MPLHELTGYIVREHHDFLRRELPRLGAMAERVAQVHGPHTPSLVQVLAVFRRLWLDLGHHLIKEEQVLFPMIASLSRAESLGQALSGPIASMIHEHDHAGNDLRELRRLTNGFEAPVEACNTYRALFAGLLELEEDLHRHIHLENSVLFPAAQQLAKAAKA